MGSYQGGGHSYSSGKNGVTSTSTTTGASDAEISKTKEIVAECMDLILERNKKVEELNEIEDKIRGLVDQLKQEHSGKEVKQMLESLMKPIKRGL